MTHAHKHWYWICMSCSSTLASYGTKIQTLIHISTNYMSTSPLGMTYKHFTYLQWFLSFKSTCLLYMSFMSYVGTNWTCIIIISFALQNSDWNQEWMATYNLYMKYRLATYMCQSCRTEIGALLFYFLYVHIFYNHTVHVHSFLSSPLPAFIFWTTSFWLE